METPVQQQPQLQDDTQRISSSKTRRRRTTPGTHSDSHPGAEHLDAGGLPDSFRHRGGNISWTSCPGGECHACPTTQTAAWNPSALAHILGPDVTAHLSPARDAGENHTEDGGRVVQLLAGQVCPAAHCNLRCYLGGDGLPRSCAYSCSTCLPHPRSSPFQIQVQPHLLPNPLLSQSTCMAISEQAPTPKVAGALRPGGTLSLPFLFQVYILLPPMRISKGSTLLR